LHSFDESLEAKGVDFVRFADDMLFCAKDEKKAKPHFTGGFKYPKSKKFVNYQITILVKEVYKLF